MSKRFANNFNKNIVEFMVYIVFPVIFIFILGFIGDYLKGN